MQRLRKTRVRALLRKPFISWSDLLAPPACARCAIAIPRSATYKRLPVFCSRCRARLSWSVCHCDPSASCDGTALPCEACAGFSPEIFRCRCAVTYQGEALRWIRRFKYPPFGLTGLDPTPLSVMVSLIHEAVRKPSSRRPDLIIPIPLHRTRLRERGFNPAALLARHAARELLSSPASYRLLVRHRATPSQTRLDRGSRLENVAGAFTCLERQAVSGKRILLVDDVVTTGATLRSAAGCLLYAGAKSVEALCVARAPLAGAGEKKRTSFRTTG